ncbi:MAG TPA: DUF2561 family protein [Mycobacterium sp.]|jgi:hypothetical protein|nr:DUF2561 family protein [Mycobacterium sp.]
MTYNTGAAARSRLVASLDNGDNLDRILLAACAVIWLAVLGSAVAATVALVDLGRGHPQSSSTSGTPWLLYAVIGVSALVIVGAIPLLVRARRTALEDPRANNRGAGARPIAPRTQATARIAEPQTQQLRSSRQGGEPSRPRGGYVAPSAVSTFDAALPPAVDRLWLRCSVVIACAMGIALLAIGIATYLMAAGHDAFAWAAYVIAGLVTLAMPAIPWIYLRQLHELMDASGH